MIGTVYWFTGLAGAGKSTIGRLFYQHLKTLKPNVVFLDGDILRHVFGNDLKHSLEERKKSAMRNARLCKMLSDQGIDVVCATISLFHECQELNRQNFHHYKEIYLRVPLTVLQQRDQKGLYSGALKGEISDVMGMDLAIEEPQKPDMMIDNTGEQTPDQILETLKAVFL